MARLRPNVFYFSLVFLQFSLIHSDEINDGGLLANLPAVAMDYKVHIDAGKCKALILLNYKFLRMMFFSLFF